MSVFPFAARVAIPVICAVGPLLPLPVWAADLQYVASRSPK